MSPEVVAWCRDFFAGLGRDVKVLEWGAGASTLEYSVLLTPGSRWLAVEHDAGWADNVGSRRPPNVAVCLVEDWQGPGWIEPWRSMGPFDAILVDGQRRPECIEAAKTMLAEGGVILLHDAQREEYHAACEGLRREVVEGSETDHLWVLRP